MKKLVLLVVFMLCFSVLISGEKWKGYNLVKIKNVKVEWVVDGDTVNVIPKYESVFGHGKITSAKVDGYKVYLHKVYGKKVMKIRMLGLECSELKRCKKRNGRKLSNYECKKEKRKGKKAHKKLISIIKKKKIDLICLEKNGVIKFDNDKFKRSLCYIEYNGEDIGAKMSKTPWCWDYNHKYPHPRENTYVDKEIKK